MPLYDLVKFKQSLINSLTVDPAVAELRSLRTRIANIKFQVDNLDDIHAEYLDQLVQQYDEVIELTLLPMTELKTRMDIIENEINDITHKLFAGNYELEERYGSIDHVRQNRLIRITADIEDSVKQRILLHTNWRYPALEIGCRDGEWTQFMVAADPLYVIDRHKEFITSTLSRFPTAYQNRLRTYDLVDHDLSALPAEQFAFVFSWGYFNYVSMDTMRQYLRQLFMLLRPGGIFLFSYNDGDTPSGAGMAENFAQTYMPKKLLIALCESLGYTIVKEFDFTPTASWIEIQKPGELKTVKAHQVLGKIVHKSN